MPDMTRTKNVLITGGTGSVGKALVEAFSSSRYQITFTYVTNEKAAKQLEVDFEAKSIRLDLAASTTLTKADIDILVNNVGINNSDAETHLVTDKDWNQTLRVNLTAAFELSRQCLPRMLEKGWGRIINISSIYGLRGIEGNLPYTVSKHGLSGLTKTIAKEYGKVGITCNEICPGPIDSDMMRRIAQRNAASQTEQQYFAEVNDMIPAGRMARPNEIAELAVFLASEAAAYINGASIPIDGGLIA